MAGGQPSGTVTFLFTDVEDSTRLWDEHRAEMAVALESHDRILRDAIAQWGGYVFSTAGDSFAAAFERAASAAAAAIDAQVLLGAENWPEGAEPCVRMGLHTGEATERDGDFFGGAVNRAARVMATAAGRQILVSLATEELLADDSRFELSAAGEHTLRGMRRPERLFDLDYPGRPADLAVPSAQPHVRTMLSSGQLVGRDAEVASLGVALSTGRVVTLVGAGGIGKTSLALVVADEVADRFPDGVRLVELAGLQSGDSLVPVAAAALGVQPRADMSMLDSIITSYRGLETLVVLDNCEHIVDAAAEFATALIERTEGVQVLATSREGLAISEERVVPVPPLGVPNESDRPDRSPAVELFLERVAAVGGAYDTLDDRTLATIGEICAQLGGLPLGIELAAARARTLSPTEILERLSEHHLLATRRRDVPTRHRTLAATIEWSHQLLEPVEQQLFDALSIFYGGFTLDAAEHICIGDDLNIDVIAELISVLVERSMIETVGRDAGVTRYAMLEPLRWFGASRLDSDARRWLKDRHLEYYVELAEESARGVQGPDEARWVRRLGDEFSNLRVALDHAVATDQAGLAVELIVHLHDYAIWRQRFELGNWAAAVLDMPGVADEPQLPLLHATAGWGASIRCDYERARQYAQAGLAAEQLPGTVETGWLHDVLAHSAYFSGDNAGGVVQSLAEIDRARAGDDLYRLAYVLVDGGTHLLIHGGTDHATALIEEGFERAAELQCPNLIAFAHHALSWLLLEQDPPAARDHALTAIDIATEIDCGVFIGLGARNLGMIAPEHADPAHDLQRIVHGAELFQRAGDDARVRMIYEYCLPTAAAVIHSSQQTDLVALATALRRRPTLEVQSVTQRLDNVLEAARTAMGAARYDEAVARGSQMSDEDLATTARSFYRRALEATAGH